MYKLAVFDMDGTLLNENDEISKVNLTALNRLKKRGCEIVLASGRQDFLLKEYIKQLEITGPVISCNGALIRNPLNGLFLQSKVLPKEIVRSILNLCKEERHHYMVYTSDVILASRNKKADFFLKRNKMLDDDCQIPILMDMDSNTIVMDYQVNKILILEYDRERFKTLAPKLSQMKGIHYCQSNEGHMDIMVEGVSKGQALKLIAELRGIDPSEIIVFGDNYNDLEMMTYGGCAITMENGVDEIKEIADYISLHHHMDGVAYAINKYVFK